MLPALSFPPVLTTLWWNELFSAMEAKQPTVVPLGEPTETDPCARQFNRNMDHLARQCFQLPSRELTNPLQYVMRHGSPSDDIARREGKVETLDFTDRPQDAPGAQAPG